MSLKKQWTVKDTRLVGEWVTVARLQRTGKQWELVRVVDS